MQLKTILNRVQKNKSFVYEEARFVEDGDAYWLEVGIRPREGSRPICSVCGERRATYDHCDRSDKRYFQFVPLWGIAVYFVYTMRRADCPQCGIRVEAVPWARGKSPLTTAYAWFLARWWKRMSWSATAKAFHTSWHNVFTSVEMAVEWGRKHADLSGITAIGVDEMAWGRGHCYMTVVYQIDKGMKRLLWIGKDRKTETLEKFFDWFGPERSAGLQYACSDMWRPYLDVIARRAGQAIHILDRFHIAAHMNKAIDKVRAEEVKKLKAKGETPILKNCRWLFLKRRENLTVKQEEKLRDVLRRNRRIERAYALKEKLQLFWDYTSDYWAGAYLDQWCRQAIRSRMDPMKRVARMLQSHRPLILNWFRAKKEFSSGVVEGLNGKAKLTTKRAYGFREFRTLQVALYHTLGNLPEPEGTHEFF